MQRCSGRMRRRVRRSFDFFVREVVREMTLKTGQKCTAIRRVLVPAEHAAAATDAIAAALGKVVVGNPANPTVTMGPVVNMAQRKSVEEGIRSLAEHAQIAYRPETFAPVDASAEQGAFVPPTLLKLRSSGDGDIVHMNWKSSARSRRSFPIATSRMLSRWRSAEEDRWLHRCSAAIRRFSPRRPQPGHHTWPIAAGRSLHR